MQLCLLPKATGICVMITGFAVATLQASCSRESPRVPLSAARITMSSSDLYSRFNDLTEEVNRSDWRSMTILSAIAASPQASPVATELEISDLDVTLPVSPLPTGMAKVLATLATSYPTFGDLADAGLMSTPKALPKIDQFRSALRESGQLGSPTDAAGLNLSDLESTQSSPYLPDAVGTRRVSAPWSDRNCARQRRSSARRTRPRNDQAIVAATASNSGAEPEVEETYLSPSVRRIRRTNPAQRTISTEYYVGGENAPSIIINAAVNDAQQSQITSIVRNGFTILSHEGAEGALLSMAANTISGMYLMADQENSRTCPSPRL